MVTRLNSLELGAAYKEGNRSGIVSSTKAYCKVRPVNALDGKKTEWEAGPELTEKHRGAG